MKKTILLTILLLGVTVISSSQVRNLSGTVKSSVDGQPLPGATVIISGTTTGSITDLNGHFTIPFSETQGTLIFTFIGMKTQEITITNSNVYDITLSPDTEVLEEVIITALGITREKKTLGYAVQDISGAELNKSIESNIVNSLSGKSAGVFVNSASGNVGSSSRIIIRGNNSLKGINQPLFVVDGIPINNSLITTSSGGMYNNDFGNAAADINPADIESISVLKGANAAALYGSRGANGVILVTTKSGKGSGYNISIETSLTFSNPLILPDYQNQYGQGNNEQFAYVDGKNGGIYDGVDETFGPPLNYIVTAEDLQPGGRLEWTVTNNIPQTVGSTLVLPQFNSPIDPETGERIPTPWIAYPDNVKNFYETGIWNVSNVAISNGGKWGNFRLSLTNSNQKGTLPNTDQRKNTINFSSNMNLSEKLTIGVKTSFFNIHSDNMAGEGYAFNNPMMQTIWGARQVDFAWLEDHVQAADGSQISWMARWHDNPYWMQYKMLDPMTRNRIIASTFLNYKITDWLHFQGRIGTDFFTQTMETIRPVGSYNKYKDGTYELYNIMNQEVNADVLLSARKELESGISLSGSVGANLMNRRVTNQNTKVAKLVVPDVYSVSNAAETPTTNSYRSEKEIQSVYATLSMGYKNQIFLDITGRNDWSSTLPANGNSYFYPSATTSWIFSETFGLNKDLFSFGKLRFGWAQVGNDTNPYQLSQTYNSSQPFGTAPSFSLGNVLPPLDLKNELIESMEVGTDIRFFSNRLGIDVTLYKTKALNQILNATITNTSGFTSVKTNAGRIDNKGIEIMLNGSPVRTSKFSWDIVVNWSKNENTVVELNDELETLQLYKMSGGNQVHAPVGGKYGTITGKGFTYNENGEIVVRANAKPQLSEQRTLGYIMPDWLGGINNTFRYKGLSMSFLIDIRHGGNIYSHTNASGWVTGVLSSSVGLNDRGVDKRLPVEDGGGITWGGVYEDGTPNTTYLDYHTARWGNNARGERFLYDASFVKLREANITFELPGDFLSRIRIKSASVSVYGRNLALLHSNVPNLDPESSAKNSSQNQMGYEYGSIPPSRHIGAKLRFTF